MSLEASRFDKVPLERILLSIAPNGRFVVIDGERERERGARDFLLYSVV